MKFDFNDLMKLVKYFNFLLKYQRILSTKSCGEIMSKKQPMFWCLSVWLSGVVNIEFISRSTNSSNKKYKTKCNAKNSIFECLSFIIMKYKTGLVEKVSACFYFKFAKKSYKIYQTQIVGTSCF